MSTLNVNSKHLKECNISIFWNISVVLVPNAEQQTQLQGPSLAVVVVPRMRELICFFSMDFMLSSYVYLKGEETFE